jgi:hypothetical protein
MFTVCIGLSCAATDNIASVSPNVKVQKDDQTITLSFADADILSYHHAIHDVPEGVDPAYRRSGFIHPLYSPSGNVLTRIQPPDHYHHYGIWAPWTKTHIEGKEVDFWNLKAKQGTVRFAELLSTDSKPGAGGFKVRQEHVQFLPEDKERVVMNEILDVRAIVIEVDNKRVWVIDCVSTFKNMLETPIELDQYRYGGGIGFRATEQWNKSNCTVLTSEGKTRNDADGTRARWCDVRGGFDDTDQTSGILFLSHTGNREHPEPMRVWPENITNSGEIFFEFCPIRLNGWTLEPDKEYVLRYRMVVYEGKLKPETMEVLWNNYVHPPVITRITE